MLLRQYESVKVAKACFKVVVRSAKIGSHSFPDRSLLLSTTVLNNTKINMQVMEM